MERNELTNVYFDESGFTGYNLLDPNQPYFVVSSTLVEPATAERLLKKSFPNYNAEEFKFSNIVNSRNEPGLYMLCSELKLYQKQCFSFVIDKKYATFSKLIDFLVEPAITNSGYDFYADGFCRKYTNYIYFGISHVSKENVYNELISAYLTFSREPSVNSLKELSTKLKQLLKRVDLEIQPFLEEMVYGAQTLPINFDLETYRNTNDLQLTAMLAVLGYWRQLYPQTNFAVIHDASSNFSRQKETWDALTNISGPEHIHPLGDGNIVNFPLSVVETTAIDSKYNYSVQLCDLLAGITSFYFKNKMVNSFEHPIQKIIRESGFDQFISNGIMPSFEFPDFPPKRLTGPDAVDMLANRINRKSRGN